MNDPFQPDWMEFIKRNPDAIIFHHPAWLQLLKECYGYQPFIIGLRNKSGEYTAGIPVMEIKNPLTGTRWTSLPFSDYCPPLVNNEPGLDDLTELIISRLVASHIPKAEFRGVYKPYPVLQAFSEHVLHVINLSRDPVRAFRQVHGMHRRNVNIALGNDVRVIRGETYEDLWKFYQLHLITRRNQGVPIQPWNFFRRLKENLLDRGYGFLLLAYQADRCIAGAVFLHWNNTLTYKYGASDPIRLNSRPNHLLMWKAIEWGCNHGFTKFDMGRSSLSNEGLRSYKSRWGAQESQLIYTSYKSDATSSRAGSKLLSGNGRLEKMMHFFIQRSPLWMCRIAGELLYRHVG